MNLASKRKWKVVPEYRRTVDGITFASGKEATRYATLKQWEKAGEVFDVRKGKRTDIYINGIKVGWYTPDFEYIDKNGKQVIEEVKSSGTAKSPYYKLRKRLFEAYTGLEVTEIIVK